MLPLLLCAILTRPSQALLAGRPAPAVLREEGTARAKALCRAKCGCGRGLAFVANSSEARHLFTGCREAGYLPKQRPAFLLVGAQKGGTTSAIWGADGRFCLPQGQRVWAGEAHFYDQPRWMAEEPSMSVLQEEYLSMWGHCGTGKSVWIEKTPNYLWAPAAALRTCQTLPGTRLAVLLRDPVPRAYSAFWNNGHFTMTPQGFHDLASVDVAIARECGGVPTGDPEQDLAGAEEFRTCCKRVAAKGMRHPRWLGCDCQPGSNLPHTCVVPYGMKDFAVVRMGLYAPQLRNWLRYHRAEELLVLFSEEYFKDTAGGQCELQCHASPESTTDQCSGVLQHDFGEAERSNSWVKGRPPMLPETEKMLREFYKPYNEELFSLLGRRANWGS